MATKKEKGREGELRSRISISLLKALPPPSFHYGLSPKDFTNSH
jgi:hypothetical protein